MIAILRSFIIFASKPIDSSARQAGSYFGDIRRDESAISPVTIISLSCVKLITEPERRVEHLNYLRTKRCLRIYKRTNKAYGA